MRSTSYQLTGNPTRNSLTAVHEHHVEQAILQTHAHDQTSYIEVGRFGAWPTFCSDLTKQTYVEPHFNEDNRLVAATKSVLDVRGLRQLVPMLSTDH